MLCGSPVNCVSAGAAAGVWRTVAISTMKLMYEYLNHVLKNYLNVSVGHSEEDAISILRKDLESSPEFSKGVISDLEKAFNDRDYSWREVMAEYDVIYADTEQEAHTYARTILWANLLGK